MFPTDCVPRNWEIRLTQALAKGTVGGRLPVLMGAPRFPPPLPASTYDVKGTLAPESEEGKLGGRGPRTFHPHPNVGVRLDCSHFEEAEAQRGRGLAQGHTAGKGREPSLTLQTSSPPGSDAFCRVPCSWRSTFACFPVSIQQLCSL